MNYRYRGFTLFELIVVLAIIATMVTVIVPYASRSNESLKLENQAQEVVNVLQYAQNIAEINKTPVRFVLNSQEKAFSLEIADKEGQFHPLSNSLGQQRHLNPKCILVDIEGFTLEGHCYYLCFDPAHNWPIAYFTIAGEDLKKTIDIQSKLISIKNEDGI